MARKNRLKMCNTKFRVLHGIGIALLALLVIIANTAGNLAGGLLNTYVGSGKPSISTPADKADWDADYYEVQYEQRVRPIVQK